MAARQQELQTIWRSLLKSKGLAWPPTPDAKEGAPMAERSKEARSKAEAIRSFLDQNQPKLPEARGFLQFLLAKEEILRRIELVDDLTGHANAILVSAKGSGTYPFFYRRGERVFHRTSQAVVELMKYVPSEIALCLSTAPPEYDEEREAFMRLLASWQDEMLMADFVRMQRRQAILEEIDLALSNRDVAAFERLSDELRKLQS
jgi:uncharacterized protein YpiB (UPF0302 family)